MAIGPLLLGALYAAGSYTSFALFKASSAGAVFFPPAGLTLAALVMSERRRWPMLLATIAAVEVLVDVSQGQALPYVFGFALANTLEPLTGAWLLTRRWPRSAPGTERGGLEMWSFVTRAVVLGPIIGATIGTATVVWGLQKGSWGSVFGPFWAGDALAVLTLGGGILAWWSTDPDRRLPGARCVVAVCAVVVGCTVVGYWPSGTPLFYVPLPIIVAAGVRYRSPVLAFLAGSVMSITANLVSVLGYGPWATVAERPHYGLATLQGFLAVATITAVLLAKEVDEHGRAVQRAAAEHSEHVRVRSLFDHAPCGVVSTRRDGTIVRVNDTFTTLVGRSAGSLSGTARFGDLLTVGGRIYYETHFAPLLRLRGFAQSIAFDLVGADGAHVPVLINAELVSSVDGEPESINMAVFDAGERRAYEQELLVERQRVERVAQQLDALQQLTARLAIAATTDEVADAVVTGGLHLVAPNAVLGVIDRRAHGMMRTWPTFGKTDDGPQQFVTLPLSAPSPVAAVARTGATLEMASRCDIAEQFPGSLQTFVDTDTVSTLGVPIVNGDKECVGSLLLGFATPGPVDAGVVALANSIATLIGSALERAWRFEEQYDNAHELQQALLPVIELACPDIAVLANYRPAFGRNDVGGDWYDVFELPDGEVAIVVGDVVGHDLAAATTMGRLQSLVRVIAARTPDPVELLHELDRAVPAVPGSFCATLFYGRFCPATGRLEYSKAGHPPPMLANAGTVEVLDGGLHAPLGVAQARTSAQVDIPVGACLVLYTDGLIDRRGVTIDESLDKLRSQAKLLATTTPTQWSDWVLEDRCGSGQADDIVLMCITRLDRQP